jgi:predicted ATPase/DNA-binding CsgD family transcriptional regulator
VLEVDNDLMPRRAWGAPLVGRATELATLDEASRAAADDSPAVVIIAGEAGIGKSRLIAEAANRANSDGWQVLSGGCLDLAEGSVPYLPLVDALHDLPTGALPPLLARWIRGAADELLPPLSEDAARGRVYAAYLDLLRVRSADAPLVLVVEDLHWADRGTQDLLSYLVRALAVPAVRTRILILLTYRSDEFPRGSSVRRWLGELARRPSVSRVDVAPLDQAEVSQQLAALGTFDARASQEIFLRSEGNPFYVEELASLWAAGQTRVPEVVRDAAEVRAASLATDDLNVVRLLAALARPARFELIQLLSGRPPPELLTTLRRAVDAGLLTVDSETAAYRFRHSLLAEAVTSDFLPGERAAVHHVIARALVDEPALSTGPGELGYHQEAAGEVDAALVSYVAAAEAATRVYAFGDAAECLERALELWSRVADPAWRTGTTRTDLLSRAAEFTSLVGEFDRATALARATLSEPDVAARAERQAETWRRIAWYRLLASDGPGAFAAYESAAAALEAQPRAIGQARLAAEGAVARAVWGRTAEASAQAQRAITLADAEGDLGARGLALNARGLVQSLAGDTEQAVSDLQQALDLARGHGTQDDVGRATSNIADTLLRAGRYEQALATCEAGINEATAQGLALSHATICRITAADVLFALGRWPEAISHVEAVRTLTEVGEAGRAAKAILARIAVARGDHGLARRVLSEVPRHGRGRDEPQLVAPAWLAVAELCAWSDLYEEGRTAVDAGLELVAGMDAWLAAQLCAVGIRIEADRCYSAHRRRARSEEATSRQHARELWATAEAIDVQNGPIGAWLAQAHAEFGRGTDRGTDPAQSEEWTSVRNRWRELGHPYHEAYANVRLAEAQLAAGDRREAAAALGRSASVAEELGATPLAALAADVRLRGGLDSTSGADEDGLTPREREVLDWVRKGASNRDIAEALFISPKTVSVHVSALLRKFGVAGRGDLRTTPALHRQGDDDGGDDRQHHAARLPDPGRAKPPGQRNGGVEGRVHETREQRARGTQVDPGQQD